MAWTIEISTTPRKVLAKLDRSVSRRIFDFLIRRVAVLDDPRSIGEPLKGPRFGMLWKYRVGDYRILCDIRDNEVVILVVRIGHRKDIYS
ncbi:MAG: type II toxin-antitoxin system RelE/ParE family toxin [Nitrospinae bacterium]|nr:type II toxin-antitoxin system RelE/ParE family toxin [Nitrospinota bacterium]